jgi:hypothetical protein
MKLLAFASTLLVVAVLSAPANAGWSCDPQENTPVCTYTDVQYLPIVISDGQNGAIAVWEDRRNGSDYDIYAQHILSSGQVDPLWPADGLAVCSATNDQASVAVTTDGQGGAYVAWDDERTGDLQQRVYVQHVWAYGEVDINLPGDGRPVAPGSYQQLQPRIAPDGAGGAIVTWYMYSPTTKQDIYAQHILATGELDPEWNAGGVYVCFAPEDQSYHVITSDGDGGIIATWWDERSGSETDIYAQHLLASGDRDPNWPVQGRALCTATDNQYFPAIVSDGAGGALVAWEDYRAPGFNTDTYVQHVFGDGVVDPAWPVNGRAVCLSAGSQSFPIICSDGSGGAIVAFQDGRSVLPGWDVFAQHVLASGDLNPAWPDTGLIVCTEAGDQTPWSMIPDGSGGALVAWDDSRGSDTDIYVQRLLPGGSLDPMWPSLGLAVSTATGYQDNPVLVASGESAIVVWNDRRGGGAAQDIYAQLIQLDGTLDDRLEQNDDCPGSRVLAEGLYGEMIVAGSDADWFQITVPRSSQLNVSTLFTHAEGDIDIALYEAPCGGPTVRISESTDDDESMSYLNLGPTIDVYVVVYLYSGTCNEYVLVVDFDGTSNLYANTTPAGWSSPAVPRDQPGASPADCWITPTLDGNVLSTYLNWASASSGPNPLPTWGSTIELDGDPQATMWIADSEPMGSKMTVDNGPFTVRGGRHTLTIAVDRDNEVPETDETDNWWSGQWVWSPLELVSEIPVVRPSPPRPGAGAEFNCDGMRFERNPNYCWVTGLAASNETDDYDLYVYDDYSGSSDGFSNGIGYSNEYGNYTDFVVGHFDNTPLIFFPSAILFSPPEGGGEFTMEAGDATGRSFSMHGVPQHAWLNHSLGPNQLTQVYEVDLVGGETYSFTLVPRGGNTDIRFAVFPDTTGKVYPRDRGDEAPLIGGSMPSLTYAVPNSGWHPIVVYRDTGTDADQIIDYDFYWNTAVTDVPGEEFPSFQLAFHGAWPNPVTGQARVAFQLSRSGPVRLNLFDLRGRLVSTLVEGTMEPGPHSVSWDRRGQDGRGLGAGVYWMRLEAEGQEIVKRVVLLE